MLTVKEALNTIKDAVNNSAVEKDDIALTQALGRVTAEDIISTTVVPHFSRSTMDGFAVIARDTFGASEGMPAFLEVKGEVLMGGTPPGDIASGETMKISTGGMLPNSADSALMLEHAEELDETMIAVYRPVAPGENVILKGEDLKEGEIILKKKHLLRPQDIGALAAAGVMKVNVYKVPKVAVISTGDELVSPQEEPLPGQIRDINSCALAAAAQSVGAIPLMYGIVKDEASYLMRAIERARKEASLILISGGSSVGIRDVTAKVIDELGNPGVLVHGISIRPGKPTIFGMVGSTPIFGLSGNPVSALVTFDLFVTPVILKQKGMASRELILPKIPAKISRNIPSSQGREDYIRVNLETDEKGQTWAVPVFGKSGLITTLVEAQGMVRISQNKEGIEKGEEVEVVLYS
ncbi:molybdopterin molybdotransferase MoeA [Candidatus Contubernalis alkaliaceticus]|uniref:molybdopterin molybdotransferase MoeA n=1 Tax=Candidatus Contubernalis alkaliaceticus TaxID=338645 RepID=UPI001F4C3362|nr:gephyrin-like molybdotransferase Glp [Candidatus Contubernalis alkalaceticus]